MVQGSQNKEIIRKYEFYGVQTESWGSRLARPRNRPHSRLSFISFAILHRAFWGRNFLFLWQSLFFHIAYPYTNP